MENAGIPSPDDAEEYLLPPCSTVSFLHAVGQSTLRQGLAVPVVAQISWMAGIQKGQCVPVTIVFGEGRSVTASLRRLNNARGHLQFRYETGKQASLRDYLKNVFGSPARCNNAVLQISEVEHGVFRFEPVSVGNQRQAHLSICRPHFHNCAQTEAEALAEFRELHECMAAVRYDETHSQADYNSRIAAVLRGMAWQQEARIIEGIGLRCDFRKNGIWVEVEFGNARVYYQDYIKFLLAARHQGSRLGILLCPTSAFAQLLCDLGQRRAMARQGADAKGRPTYSGMMSYEKAIRELPFLEFMLTSGMVIAGLEIQSA